jgi:predicted dehydrogenase
MLPLRLLMGLARIVIVDPGHFHATLLQKEMYPDLDPKVAVYAPLGPELIDYLNRISLFNTRKDNPTRWQLDVHTSDDAMGAMLRDRPGTAVVFTGRNRGKIDRILQSLSAGLHVFADKPWIISSRDMPKLDEALALAERKGLAAYDIMTERYEITSELQRAFVNDPEIFGRLERGTAESPAIRARSVHHIMKMVAGLPLRRPAWFFDVTEYGEALADVGTHVVDLVQWTAFPDQAIDYRKDIQMLAGRHWPLAISPAQFHLVTGVSRNDTLEFFCNNAVEYTLRGVRVKLEILWNWEAPAGSGDVYESSFRGTRARVEIRQPKEPELYVAPASAAVRKKVAALQSRWPGLSVEESNGEAHIVVPAKLRIGDEEHFAQVATRFLEYMKSPKSMPSWERPNMLAKYYVSTKGVELSQ